eukprot:CAMPEP_0168567936 /NCGR_PEP_ID=MMETSP0413-20121227/15292_1 /TAXON_ID=136452 /ORGANISM="Filamoeba nolandi, Strain NC-AS-23-1" /LENGTH=37 /DNA_ID= /DNA_START= /DNA_END= /DNA_ORIENTATION=
MLKEMLEEKEEELHDSFYNEDFGGFTEVMLANQVQTW